MSIAIVPQPRFSFQGIQKLLINPWLLVAMAALGVWIGLNRPEIAKLVAPIGSLYIELLRMVLLPFLICAIMVSVARLFSFDAVKLSLRKIIIVFLMATCAAAMIGTGIMAWLQPGNSVGESSRKVLGEILNTNAFAFDYEITLDRQPHADQSSGLALSLVQSFVPGNIFNALSVGETIKILVFAIIFGISLGQIKINERLALKDTLISVYTMCTRIIDTVNLMLPFALCAMLAKQVSDVGLDQLFAMLNFLLTFGLVAISTVWISVAVVAMASNSTLLGALVALRSPLMVAVATRSSIACVPSSMSALSDDLGLDREKVQLLLPLGMTLCRVGPILYYAIATMFIAQLHNIGFTPAIFLAVLLGSWLAGLASAGTTGVLTINLLSIIFEPIGLPLDGALVLFVAVDPIADIFRTMAIVLPNCAATAVLSRRSYAPATEAA